MDPTLEDELSALFANVAVREVPHKASDPDTSAPRPPMDNGSIPDTQPIDPSAEDVCHSPRSDIASEPHVEPPPETQSTLQLPLVQIRDLDMLHAVLQNPEAQKALITLYADSQAECKRNGMCGMEIGMAREKDQCAVLKLFLGDMIRLDIDNSLTEDFLINNEKVSSKHSSSKVGSPVKIKWTSADTSVKQAIQDLIDGPDASYPHLLLTYLGVKEKTITIVCCSAQANRNVIKELGTDAFTVPKGNSRGIEYSRKAMKKLCEKPYFKVVIKEADINSGLDPIQRRMNILKNMGIEPQN
jgi:hypothetical protein